MMLTITIPSELVAPLTEEAARRGTTPELLALEGVRRVLPESPPAAAGTLHDRLKDYIGAVDGSSEPFSQDCGKKFAEDLAAGRPARP